MVMQCDADTVGGKSASNKVFGAKRSLGCRPAAYLLRWLGTLL